jgi:peptidoglycan/LPS O-acetylase OafA/YrhL
MNDTKNGDAPLGRYLFLEIARGVAVLGVMLFHRGTHISLVGTPLDPLARDGIHSVQIFFIISGFVIYPSLERYRGKGAAGAGRFLWRRLRRIYPPFWISLALAYCVSIFIEGAGYAHGEIAASAFLLPPILGAAYPNGTYWMLVIEQQFYIVMALLCLPIWDRFRVWLILLSAGVAILPYIGMFGSPLVQEMLPRHWLNFLLGICIYLLFAGRQPRRLIAIVLFGLWLFALTENHTTRLSALMTLLLVVWYPFDAPLSALPIFTPLRWLGRIAYSLYLIHMPIYGLYDALFLRGDDRTTSLHYWGAIVAALIAGIGFFYLVERHFYGGKQRANAPYIGTDAPINLSVGDAANNNTYTPS